MCGRFALGYDADEVVAYFGAQQAALQSDSEGEEEEEPRAASAEAEQQPVASGSGAGRRVYWASEEAKEGYRPRYNVRSCVAGVERNADHGSSYRSLLSPAPSLFASSLVRRSTFSISWCVSASRKARWS